MQRIWGFDLGTASVGFAVVEPDGDKREGRILRLGVRIFPEGVEEKRKEPRNLARRQTRLMRRQIRRRRWRKRHLRIALGDAGLLPGSEREPSSRATEFFSRRSDPYKMRADAVTRRLELFDIGRALFHLSKHRAFTGSRKFGEVEAKEPEKLGRKAQQLRERLQREIAAGKKERVGGEKDDEAVKPEIELHKAKIGDRSLGQYLVEDFPKQKRGWHFQRAMVKDEFDRIWSKQSEFHDALRNEELRDRIRRIIFDQRPTYFRPGTVGKCDLEPAEDRCLKADWHAQRFIMLQMLNSLRLEGDRPLSEEQRGRILSSVEAREKVKFETLRGKRALNLPNDKDKFNFEVGGKKDMLGNATEAKLAAKLGDGWAALPARDEIRDQIAQRLWHVEYRLTHNGKRAEILGWQKIAAERQKFAVQAVAEWGVTSEQAKALSELSLPDGYAMHSKKAILKMLPFLEQGLRYDQAKEKAYPHRAAAIARHDMLPPPEKVLPSLRNPTVMRTLNELRNVVNNLLRVHGRPDLIRVELARDLKLPRQGRLDVMNRQRENGRRREKAKEELANNNVEPSGLNIEKYLLAEEQGWRCPYSGECISWDGLFRTGLFQVDHILPRARSLDNTFGNKVVCHRDFNDRKKMRTPYEAWGGDPEQWARILKFLGDMEERNKFPGSKISRIKTENYPAQGSDEFTERQLRDTAYASRLAREYLETLGIKVEPANGRVTRVLRHRWGLDLILSDDNAKNRNDHRHHALDALVVALTTPAFVKRAGGYYAADIRPHDENLSERWKERMKRSFEPPWDTIHADAERAASEIIVSHRAQRKVSGALHDQMPWGDTGKDVIKNRISYRLYAQRKDRTRRLEKKQTSLMRGVGPDQSAWVEAKSNHHMLIYKKDGKLKYQIVPMFDAAMRIARREPVVNRVPEPGASEARSLCIGDTLERTTDGETTYWVVKSLWANGQITIQPHNLAQNLERTSPIATKLFREGARKVVVDPIGRVFPAND